MTENRADEARKALYYARDLAQREAKLIAVTKALDEFNGGRLDAFNARNSLLEMTHSPDGIEIEWTKDEIKHMNKVFKPMPGIAGRIGIVLYYLGCIVSWLCVIGVGFAFYETYKEIGFPHREFVWWVFGGLAAGFFPWLIGNTCLFILAGEWRKLD
jgi:hypothetical protein